MRLARLSRISIGACLVGLVALLAVAIGGFQELRQRETELGAMLDLRARIDDFSVASDSLLLLGAGPDTRAAYRDEARALQADLRQLGATHPDARKAAHRIGVMVQAVLTELSRQDARGDASGGTGVGPLDMPIRGRIIMNQVANHGIALDTTLDAVVDQRRRDLVRETAWIGAALAGAAVLFAALCLSTFTIVQRRIVTPVRGLLATLERIRAGDPHARASVAGNDELATLAATLNRTLDERDAADTRLREQQAWLTQSQRIGRIGSWRMRLTDHRLEWSHETYRITGLAPESYTPTPKGVMKLLHRDDRRRLLAARATLLRDRRAQEVDYRLVHPDGTIRHVHERAEVDCDADGVPVAIAGTVQDITERRVLDERLQQYVRLVEGGGDLCATCDTDYRYVLANRAYAERYGLEPGEIEGRYLWEIMGERYFENELRHQTDRCLAGESRTFETRRDMGSLEARDLLVRYHPIFDEAGDVTHVCAVITDITEMKAAERTLHEQATLLDIAGRTARLGGWSVDLTREQVAWTDVTCEIHGMPSGYSPTVEEAVGFYAPGWHRERIQERFVACRDHGRPFDEELKIFNADGETVWVRATGEAVAGPDGRTIRLQGGFQDITDQHRLSGRLRAYRQLIENSENLFLMLDANFRYTLVNRAYADMHGRDVADIEGKPIQSMLGQDYFDRNLRPAFERCLAGEPQHLETEYDYPALGHRHLDERLNPIATPDGRITHIGVVMSDVTEMKRSEQVLREQEESLRRSHDDLSQLLETRKALINSLPAHIAVLDHAGTILDVNDQWRQFAQDNEFAGAGSGIGENYIAVCEGGIGEGECAEDAAAVAAGLREVLAQRRDVFVHEYPCHGPDEQRWFRVTINRLLPTAGEPENLGAVVMHVNITERKLAEQELNRIAYTDPLTGLLSRNGFSQAVGERLGAEPGASGGLIVMLDVQGQRDVNDAHGYDTGDRLLIELGARLREQAGDDGITARIGGDEFALYLAPRPQRDIDELMDTLANAIRAPFAIDGTSVEIMARFGFTRADDPGRNADDLLREAEVALFHVRSNPLDPGSDWLAYSQALDEQVHNRVRTTHELQAALRDEEFELHFQPKVDLRDGRLLSAEALIRWHHPERGLVPPNEFIPVAEQSQLIGPIGDWALRTACRQVRAWADAGLPVVPVSVNVSVVQFTVGDLTARVRDALAEFEVDPAHLVLEITESVFERESETLLEQIHAIHALGVRLSLDDFGTGYSSLLYLQKYPFNEIKIDQGFVRGLLDDRFSQDIVRTVLGLASALRAEVIAEGIESTAIRDALVELGCTTGQGFHYSRPLEADDFSRLLAEGMSLPLTGSGGG